MRSSFYLISVCAVAALAAGGAKAQPAENGNAAVGVGMICDTPEQAAQFVSLREHGTPARNAMDTVNKDAGNPRACGVAAIAFVRGDTLASRPVKDRLVQVVKINVVAGFDGAGWRRVHDTIQFAVVEGEGEAI